MSMICIEAVVPHSVVGQNMVLSRLHSFCPPEKLKMDNSSVRKYVRTQHNVCPVLFRTTATLQLMIADSLRSMVQCVGLLWKYPVTLLSLSSKSSR